MKHVLFWMALVAASHQGHVRLGEVSVPGVSVQATQGDKTLRTVTDGDGRYVIPDLSDGAWVIEVSMPGFETLRKDVTASNDGAALEWDIKMRPLAEINGESPTGFPKTATPGIPALQVSAPAPEAANGLLINGSVSNGGATTLGLVRGFGNNRVNRTRFPYKGSVLINGNNSLFDARSYSLSGQDIPQPDYRRLLSSITLQGPFQIPHVFRNGQLSFSYSRTQNRNASLQTALMPTAAERAGYISSSLKAPVDPETGLPFSNGLIPQDRISPQAASLLALYPLPNFSNGSRYNYEVPVVGVTHGDNFQVNVGNLRFGRDSFSIGTTFSSTRSDNPDLFGFTDRAHSTSTSATVGWNHRFTTRFVANMRYSFSRNVAKTLPYFANQIDVSGNAGITGNDPDPRNWGPPGLSFASGIAFLSGGTYAFNRNQSNTASYASNWVYHRHAFGYGVDHQWQQFNLFSQQNARGVFTFTGAEAGNDFADFLLGVPTASSLAFGNADKYFRQSVTNAYLTDDFKMFSTVTLNAGVRWEYESPIVEKYGRLVNLDIAPGFTSVTPVIAGNGDNSLIRPNHGGIQPRIGLAWRPRARSSTVVRAGYGIYQDASVYRSIADQMAQQSPLSKSLSVQNTPSNPLTLADGFKGSSSVTATTFAVDPYFRPGTAQNWSLSIQQNLPALTVMTVTYLGIKGTHVPQRVLPNTFPTGAVNPCDTCPAGFVYLTSTGNTSRNSGSIEVRKRQRNGFEIGAMYTFAKAIDDAGLGGNLIAQDWLNRSAERGLSNFDQRHLLTVQGQYTSGMSVHSSFFSDSWSRSLLKSWTLASQMTLGSGMPLTPVILAPVQGTGMTGSLRPNVTGAPIEVETGKAFLNLAAFAAPASGEWGNAPRNSITGPSQFSLNASLSRGFKISDRINMEFRVNAMNVLNHVTFPSWNTTVNSAQFGLPSRANAMRTIQPSLRVSF
jgi:hypothetical protein